VLPVVVTLVVGLTTTRATVAGAAQRAALPSAPTVAAATVAAIGRATTDSLYIVTVDYAQGRTLYYVDPAHHAEEMVFTNPSGVTQDAYAVRPGSGGRADTRTVDYVRHTWRDRTTSGSESVDTMENPAHGVALELRNGVLSTDGPAAESNGTATLTGIEVVDGERAYRVVLALPEGGELATIWLSTTTALPVRSTSPGVTVTYRWHVPRGDVPASLWPTVPCGFSDVTTKA
jgi:hypothetical protein